MKLIDYIRGDRRGTEAHRIEKAAMEDPFLSEAIEGYDAVEGDHDASLERLCRWVAKRTASRGKRRLSWIIGTAAAAVLLFFLAIGDWFLPWKLERNEAAVPYLTENVSVKPAESSEPEASPLPDSAVGTTPAPTEPATEPERTLQTNAALSQSDAIKTEDTTLNEQKSRQTSVLSDTEENVRLSLALPATKSLSNNKLQIQNEQIDSISMPSAAANESTGQADEETIIIAYGTVRKREFTGSVPGKVDSAMQLRPIVSEGVPVGGMEAFRRYVQENLNPIFDENEQKITGMVGLEFRVNDRGRPVNIRVTQRLTPQADAEARRLLEQGPDWRPTPQLVRIGIEF